MVIPLEVVDRYRKVKRLHLGGGTPAECDTARKICEGMDAKYPGLAREAARQERGGADAQERSGGFDPGPGPFTGRHPDAAPATWGTVFNEFREFLHDAADRMQQEQESRADEADQIVDDCVKITSRVRSDGKIVVTATISPGDVAAVLRASCDLGTSEISRRVGEDVAAEFDSLLTELCAERPRQRRR